MVGDWEGGVGGWAGEWMRNGIGERGEGSGWGEGVGVRMGVRGEGGDRVRGEIGWA